MLTKKQVAALIAIVFIIIVATVLVGRGLAKKQQEILVPSGDKNNFLQQYSLPENEKEIDEAPALEAVPPVE